MDNEREYLTFEQAHAMLSDDDRIHTFRDTGIVKIGAHWDRDNLLAVLRKYKPQKSGPAASRLHHGLVIIDDIGPLFIETRSV